MPQLILLFSTNVGESSRIYPIGEERITIGRSDEADIQVFDSGVSRLHAALEKVDSGTIIKDLDTKNGTFVNGVRLKKRTLQEGDIITIGRTQFIYTQKEWMDFIGEDFIQPTQHDSEPRSRTEILSVDTLANEIATLTQKISLVFWMSRIIQEEGDVPSFLKKSLTCVLNGMKAQRGSLYLLIPSQGLKKVAEAQIASTPYPAYKKEKKLALEAYSRGKGIILQERVDKTFYTLLSVPLKTQSKTTGVMYLESPQKQHYLDEDFRFLNIAANIISVNAENRRLIRHLKKAHRHVEEYSAFGEILSCIAHELKSPLTTALGYSELLSREEEDETKLSRLESIGRELNRSVKIIENMLTFARKREATLVRNNVNEVLSSAIDRKESELKPGIELEKDLSDQALLAEVDALQLEQVFINLLKNAEEAILESKTEGKIHVKSRHNGDRVIVEIRDTGKGISTLEESKIFKPFYTTKRGGTGLGLSLCSHIIKAHFGKLSITNAEEGSGAVVRVELPTPE